MAKSSFNPDSLAEHLDEVLPPGKKSVHIDYSADPLVDAARALAETPPPALSFDAMARIQSQMLTANAELHQSSAAPKRTRRIIRFTQAMMTAAASFILLLSVVMPVIGSSVPGDTFYPLKRGLEGIQVQTGDLFGANEAEQRLSFAERRAREAMALIDDGEFDPELIDAAVAELVAAAEVAERTEDGRVSPQLIGQTVQVNALLDYVLARANFEDGVARDELDAASMLVSDVRSTGVLLLPSAVAPLLPGGEANNLSPPTEEPPSMAVNPDLSMTMRSGGPEVTEEPDPEVTPEPEATEEPDPETTAEPEITAEPDPETTPEPEITEEPDPETTAEPDTATLGVVISNGLANVRSGPGTTFDIIATLRPNMQVEIIGQNDDASWVQIIVPTIGEGWIAEFLISEDLTQGVVTECNGASCDPVDIPGQQPADADQPDSPGNSDDAGDFGCDQPGNACNAPGQTGEAGNGQPENPGNSNNNPGNQPENPGNPGGNPGGGNPGNPGGGRP